MNQCGCGFVLTGTAKDMEAHRSKCIYAECAKLRAERDAALLQLGEAERKGKDLCQMNGELLMTLHEIARGAGPYSRDPLEHATNTIEAMKQLAKNAIAIPEMRVGRPLEGS